MRGVGFSKESPEFGSLFESFVLCFRDPRNAGPRGGGYPLNRAGGRLAGSPGYCPIISKSWLVPKRP